ncbi:MAG: ESPR-type extended signal peptide-containing protein [Phascolarctobacterium sp.]|uniref:ESPR-type extended signal peptide-containing protein n=1 Tax=Phascolarctobacterium sp. TaxID=2049039 RepID=UPI0026DCB681|nr:ESPR-type extended signal peptide-containing protein [Phascolarctobacterium sp.]MDO4922266.1 ESPR-type extended signal peptide-containing protein [Phascolarctobacterium sp.]
MNKVFKVVWSKARGCYVVASEFAKSHTKGGRSMKTMVVATAAALTLGMNGLALAAVDTTPGTGDGVAIGTNSEALKDTDTAIGKGAQAKGTEYDTVDKDSNAIKPSGNTTAIGSNSFAQYSGSTAIGVGAKASGGQWTITIDGKTYQRMGNSTAVGYLSEATVYDSTALGYTSKASSRAAVALGARANASGEASVATGASSLAHEKFSAAYGAESKAYGNYGTALGAGAQTGLAKKYDASGNEIIDPTYSADELNTATSEGTAVGFTAVASNRAATALGARANASGEAGIAAGASSVAHEKYSAAFGAESKAYGENGTALGAGAQTGLEKRYDDNGNEIQYTEKEIKELAENNKITKDGTAVGTDAVASNRAAAALGARSTASGDASIALGASSTASGESSAALGSLSTASGASSTALGASSTASEDESTALGTQSTASGKKSMALGVRSTASGEASVTLGVGATAAGDNSLALGTSSTVYGDRSIAIGYNATIGGNAHDSIAIGKESGASGPVSMALGRKATASATYGMALGVSSTASGNSSLALGYQATAGHANSVALGDNSATAAAVGTSNFTLTKLVNKNGKLEEADIIFGTFAGNSPTGTVSIGSDSIKRTLTNLAAGRITATSTDAINGSQLFAVADGLQNQINDLNQKITEGDHYHTVNGNASQTGTGGATTGGDTGSSTTTTNAGSESSSSSATAGTAPTGDKPELNNGYVGKDGNLSIKYATDDDGKRYYDISMNSDLKLNSVTFGGTVVNEGGMKFNDTHYVTNKEIKMGDTVINDNSVKVGDTINIDNSTKNISVGKDVNIDMGDNQIHNVAAGTADTDAVNYGQLKQVEQNITNNSVQINKLGDRIDKVGAGAAALAALHPLDFDPDDKFYLSAGYGNYRGENAAAIGAFYQPNDDTLFSVSSTVGNDDDMINAGVTWRFGQSSNQSRSKKAMAKEIIELRTEVAELKAMVYNLTGYGLDLEKTKIFPDTPENHWAYDYVAVAAGNGILEGYPDGQFDGSRPMTRYEMAAVVYRLLKRGAQVDNRMLLEFAPELARIKVDTVTRHKDGTPSIQRVRVIEGRG